jgi:hypothetical protein
MKHESRPSVDFGLRGGLFFFLINSNRIQREQCGYRCAGPTCEATFLEESASVQ